MQMGLHLGASRVPFPVRLHGTYTDASVKSSGQAHDLREKSEGYLKLELFAQLTPRVL